MAMGHPLRPVLVALLLLLVFVVSLVPLAPPAHAQSIVATVSVGDYPQGVAYDSSKGEVFVSNSQNNTISVISDANNTVIATVDVGAWPRFVAYDSSKGEVFVANSQNNTISVISDANNTVVAAINVGRNPVGVAYDSSKGEVFVSNADDNTVSVTSETNNTVIATVNVGERPIGVAYDSSRGELFVANYENNTISVISDSTNAVVATLKVGSSPVGVAYDSSKGEVFVANFYGNTVSVISDATNATSNSTTSTTSSISFTGTSSVQVGVEAGDWLKISYALTGAPAGTVLPTSIRLDFLSVQGSVATVLVTMHMSDGTEQNSTVNADAASGEGTAGGILPGIIIPTNSKVGDSFAVAGLGNVTFAGEETRTYAGASRTVLRASVSQYGTDLTYYWDRKTGVIVEADVASGTMSGNAKVTDTNLWASSGGGGVSGFPMTYAVMAVVAVGVVGVGVYLLRRRRPQIPEGRGDVQQQPNPGS